MDGTPWGSRERLLVNFEGFFPLTSLHEQTSVVSFNAGNGRRKKTLGGSLHTHLAPYLCIIAILVYTFFRTNTLLSGNSRYCESGQKERERERDETRCALLDSSAGCDGSLQ
ncbi:hypothetical protein PMIN06_009218 [Paraphaeosphaeria minitans]